MTHTEGRIPHPLFVAAQFERYFSHLQITDPELTTVRLAELFGYENAEPLDRISGGVEYSSFVDLHLFAKLAGLDHSWLINGTGTPFARDYRCCLNLRTLLQDLPRYGTYRLYAVRSEGPNGEVCFVIQINDFSYRIFPTKLRLSKMNGPDGAEELLTLLYMLIEIETKRIPFPLSATIPELTFNSLINGETYPGSIIHCTEDDKWAGDFIDYGMDRPWKKNLPCQQGPQFDDAIANVRTLMRQTEEAIQTRRNGPLWRFLAAIGLGRSQFQ